MRQQREPHVLIVLSTARQAAICGNCSLPECDLRAASCPMRRANAKAKAGIVGYQRRARLARRDGRGYWPEIHGTI